MEDTPVSAQRPGKESHRPSDYGDPLAEARSLRQGCGVVHRSSGDLLVLRGEDRHRFLNGQMTCDVAELEPGQGAFGFFTTVKGRIEADATVLAREDGLLLVLPPGLGAAIRQRLERYIIVDRVEIREPQPLLLLSIIGPEAAPCLERVFGISAPPVPWQHLPVEVRGETSLLLREGRLGSHAWSLWMPPSSEGEILDRLRADPRCRFVGGSAFEAFRIEAGMSRFGQDFGPENLPQETGIEAAVSYDKGCYLGQEVVARLHYRGQVSRQLRILEIPTLPVPPLPSELTLEGRPAGRLTSATLRPGGEGALGIGWVQRRAFAPGTELEIASGGRAIVRGLPSPAAAPTGG